MFGSQNVWAGGLTLEDLRAVRSGTEYYKPGQTNCGGSSNLISPSSAAAGDGIDKSGSWNSGLTPPYILEQFAIEVLKNVSQKMNVPVNNMLTQNHVIAMVGFAMGEGGDINNQDLFNPMNTGIDAPDLVDGAHRGNGVQSFKSFDAGVEAMARTLVRPQYSRMFDVLANPDSNPQDFIYALTYFQKYPDNKIWAEGSDPAYHNQGQAGQDAYYQNKLSATNNVVNHYEDTAALVIGTSDKELILHETRPDLLQYHPAGGTTYVGAASNCNNLATSDGNCNTIDSAPNIKQKIVSSAICYSWPTTQDGNKNSTIKPEYAPVLQKYNPNANAGGKDCGTFVATVMRATGADPNYPLSGTSVQADYVLKHPELYDVVPSVADTSEMQPGDIMIVRGTTGAGHTYIYVGTQPNGTNEASASLNERFPGLGHAVTADKRGNYMRVRLKA